MEGVIDLCQLKSLAVNYIVNLVEMDTVSLIGCQYRNVDIVVE